MQIDTLIKKKMKGRKIKAKSNNTSRIKITFNNRLIAISKVI